ncbi:MAG: ABC transporter ATP-binding protein [Bacilli bacterium]|nr:ABC transporter ATP-binding protein [Bacilli bacterium]
MKLKLEGITKVFASRRQKGKEVTAVNNFTYEFPDGQLVGLLGPSGCGKSTTLYMICGLQKPTKGKIFFGDDDVTELTPENRGVGLVFQNYALYPHMSVKQNIMFPLENLKGADKLNKDEMLKRAYDAAKLVQIDDLMDRKPSELSGGQQQRVAIARALVKMPRVLLLDEPLSNLDARLRLQTREEIKRIQRETGITTVFVTHDQDEAMSISDQIVVMKRALVQQIGKPQDVYDNPANLFVAKFLGVPPINVFKGEVKNNKLYIDGKEIMPFKGVEKSYEDSVVTLKEKINYFIENARDVEKEKYAAAAQSGDTTGLDEFEDSIFLELLDQQKKLNAAIEAKVYNVYVGIRPEGFILDDNGNFPLELDKVEVMGRDISLICKSPAAQSPTVRAIISSDFKISEDTKEVKFNLKPHKVFVFNGETEERIIG